MRNKTFSVVYSLVLVMMIAAAVLVAIDALSTTAVIVVAVLGSGEKGHSRVRKKRPLRVE